MTQVALKTHYSASELAAMHLPGLPATKVNIIAHADRSVWAFNEVNGRGGLRREYSPPEEVMAAIRAKAVQELGALAQVAPTPAVVAKASGNYTREQNLKADARNGVLLAIQQVMTRTGYPLKKAARTLLELVGAGHASPQLVAMLKLARDERGRSSPDGLPSERSLVRFVEYQKAGQIVPKKRTADMSIPPWAQAFMSYYQKPEKPTVAHAYQLFVEGTPGDHPSIHQVQRFLTKVGNVSLQAGRMGERELKNLKPFIRRSFDHLLPADVYSADGHKFDAEVQHPLHGRPHRPEITTMVCIGTRKAIGWSVGLSESALTVLDALRNAVENGGIPAILYVDNGSGYVNQMMEDEATGFVARLGSEMVHSLPYNSQARGVIERFHQTLTKAAKEMPGYIGAEMDREAKHNIFKLSRKALKAKTNGATVVMPLMGWPEFTQFLQKKFDAYNNRPHSTLPKITDPQTGRRRHQSPNEAWAQAEAKGFAPHMVSKEESIALFRPQIMRTVRRCEVELFGMRYFNKALEEFNGELLPVSYDIHDPQMIWVYAVDGRLICDAELDANKVEYMAQSFVDQAQAKRAAGREKRLKVKLGEIHAERDGALALEVSQGVVIPSNINEIRQRWAMEADEAVLIQSVKPVVEMLQAVEIEVVAEVEISNVTVLPESPQERFKKWVALDEYVSQGGVMDDPKLTRWYGSYQQSNEFRTFEKRRIAMQEEGQIEQSTVATVLCMNQN
ncbi:MAG: Mu transposase C-terminal domain-containing protein [Undibacterium sp.]|uniref:Mu transposase C-terminal domain-containing protein n=1 Tax=Undibacterium sp. TaxID=1914977 RepID=UPI002725450B|nr:Mu transposase C-terminal domain-containing protein [Undibacterium sp.]MDO8654223.1 Mu transposase C-terminal domain-containing protein [Undibacterium sp.]